MSYTHTHTLEFIWGYYIFSNNKSRHVLTKLSAWITTSNHRHQTLDCVTVVTLQSKLQLIFRVSLYICSTVTEQPSTKLSSDVRQTASYHWFNQTLQQHKPCHEWSDDAGVLTVLLLLQHLTLCSSAFTWSLYFSWLLVLSVKFTSTPMIKARKCTRFRLHSFPRTVYSLHCTIKQKYTLDFSCQGIIKGFKSWSKIVRWNIH